MHFAGFQKLTLLDFPGKVASIVFTPGCNFRCPFCHNYSIATMHRQAEIPQEEVLSYLGKRKGVLDGVCISGGEPLLCGGLIDFMKKVKDMGYLVKLDTNGSFPKKFKEVIDLGLVDYVAMDIKNSAHKYCDTSGAEVDIRDITGSIDIIMSDAVDYEFRTTVIKEYHTTKDIEQIASSIKGAKRYFIQNFVNSPDVYDKQLTGVDDQTLSEMKTAARKYVEHTEIRGK